MSLVRRLPPQEFARIKQLGIDGLTRAGQFMELVPSSTGRAHCRACGTKIAKGASAVRLRLVLVERGDRSTNSFRRFYETIGEPVHHGPKCRCEGTTLPTLPGVHLTTRAYEWLSRATTWYKNGTDFYRSLPGDLACPSPFVEHRAVDRGRTCSVEDVRAMLLKQEVKVMFRPGYQARTGDDRYRALPVKRPTCVNCCLILDHALEHATPKSGPYLTAFRDYERAPWQFKWVDPSAGAQCAAPRCRERATFSGAGLCRDHLKRQLRQNGSVPVVQDGSRSEADRGSST